MAIPVWDRLMKVLLPLIGLAYLSGHPAMGEGGIAKKHHGGFSRDSISTWTMELAPGEVREIPSPDRRKKVLVTRDASQWRPDVDVVYEGKIFRTDLRYLVNAEFKSAEELRLACSSGATHCAGVQWYQGVPEAIYYLPPTFAGSAEADLYLILHETCHVVAFLIKDLPALRAPIPYDGVWPCHNEDGGKHIPPTVRR